MFCRHCGQPMRSEDRFCGACGKPATVAAPPAEPDPALRYVLPVGRSGWALAAGYLGLFSPLVIFAPFALIAGLLALRDLRRNPARLGRGRAWFGIVMGGIFTVLLLVIAFSIATE